MKFEQLEPRNLMCAEIDFNDWIVGTRIGDWHRDVRLGVPESYELKVVNTHPTCAIDTLASANNLHGGTSTYEEASFERFENTAVPIDYDGTLESGEEVTFVMRSTPKFANYATLENPGTANAEVLLFYGDNGDVCMLGISGKILFRIADANLDGEVSLPDFVVLAANYGKQVDNYLAGDFDLSGTVDFADFLILSHHFGKVGPGEGH